MDVWLWSNSNRGRADNKGWAVGRRRKDGLIMEAGKGSDEKGDGGDMRKW